jgi:aminoglycoside phosphotransferase (APT) family kinase protein
LTVNPVFKSMSKRLVGTDLVGHPAAQAWARLRPGRAGPTAVVRLQKKAKGVVYRLEGAGPGGSAIIAKHSSPERIHRERAVYEQVLPALPVPTVRYHGFVEEPGGEGCWLFLEEAGGEGYSPRSAEHRALAGRWLGLLHASGARVAATLRQPDRGPDHYLGQLHSAHATLLRHRTNPALTGGDVAVLGEVVRQCEAVAAHWGQVQRLCAGMPCTFIHGDFAPKNVRVRSGPGGPALVPFDWGSAGWGVPAADLVQAGSAPDTDWDYWASPDLAAYCSAAREAWPHLDLQDLRGAAVLGKVFRCLVCINLDARSFATEWVERAMRNMKIYRAQLTDAIRAAGWPA